MSGKYGTGEDSQYCYPNSDVLINRLGIVDKALLESAETALTERRADAYVPNFDELSLSALCAIHFHLFQDVYDWAGEFRTVDISKGSTRFANVRRIEPEAQRLFQQLEQERYLTGLSKTQFASRLAHYYCELNVIHPFRDGNGRAQRLLFEVISINAGFAIRWKVVERIAWRDANIAGYVGQLAPLTMLIDRAIEPI
jgi:cell filamentation protein